MKKEQEEKIERTVVEGLDFLKEKAETEGIHTFVFIGLSDKGNEMHQYVLGLDTFQYQLLGSIAIVERDILNQVPEVKAGQMV